MQQFNPLHQTPHCCVSLKWLSIVILMIPAPTNLSDMQGHFLTQANSKDFKSPPLRPTPPPLQKKNSSGADKNDYSQKRLCRRIITKETSLKRFNHKRLAGQAAYS